jgi:hypothetical protein
MPTRPNVKVCTHIKVNGVRCGSPALRGEQFCYFHQRMIRGVRTPGKSRLHPIALIEDEAAIQSSLMEVINALARNTIDLPRAELLLRALNAAVRNSGRVHFGLHEAEMVKEVPEYPDPPRPEPVNQGVGAGDPALTQILDPADVHGFTGVPSAPPYGSKELAEADKAERQRLRASRLSHGGNLAIDSSHRKPPHTVPQEPAPKERRNAARGHVQG